MDFNGGRIANVAGICPWNGIQQIAGKPELKQYLDFFFNFLIIDRIFL